MLEQPTGTATFLFKEIVHHEDLDTRGKTIYREAVRGIIIPKNRLLMVYSSKNGDYKFPGGGVDDGESYEETLLREIQEECGATVSHIGQEFSRALEYSVALDDGYDVFNRYSRF